MIITLVDIVAFFDREDICDVMQTLHKIGVNQKAARVWFKLNEKTEIAVKTASGITETDMVGDCIGQGTAGAALVSQVNLDQGLMDYFEDSKDEVWYGGVRLQPLSYQDDIMKSSRNVMDTQVGNIKLAAMLQEKGLEAHPDKTCFIVCGSNKYKQNVDQDLKRQTIMFGEFPVKHREYDRYLGQILHGGGLEQSAETTVMERVGRIKGATLEIKTIIEEFQMQALGGMMAAWVLWERALVPALLSGAGTWFGLRECKKAVELCESLQNFFWRVMLKVPESCPKLALRCETGMMGMKWRIWQEKIFLLLRIKKQPEGVLARQVYEEGRAKGWPGLSEDVSNICKQLVIPDVNDALISKASLKKAILGHHYKELKQEMEGLEESQKLYSIKHDDFSEVQEYFKEKSVESVRMAFKVRSLMVSEIPGNFKAKYRKNGQGDKGLLCTHCEKDMIMTQSHCLECPALEEMREGLELSNIMDLVTFFRKLLVERTRLDALQDV